VTSQLNSSLHFVAMHFEARSRALISISDISISATESAYCAYSERQLPQFSDPNRQRIDARRRRRRILPSTIGTVCQPQKRSALSSCLASSCSRCLRSRPHRSGKNPGLDIAFRNGRPEFSWSMPRGVIPASCNAWSICLIRS
jgi:hypothetical protein